MDESRKQFEEEYHKLMGTSLSVIKKLREGEDYRYTEGNRLQIAWKMWQASRAAIEIELPSLKQSESGERYVWSDGVSNFKKDTIDRLRAAGLKVK